MGHKNVKTFLKGVAFACDDAYVTTGGDCGGMFVWNKETCELVCRAQADGQVVNNVCPHPSLPCSSPRASTTRSEYGNRVRDTTSAKFQREETKTRTTTRRPTSRMMSWRSSSAGSSSNVSRTEDVANRKTTKTAVSSGRFRRRFARRGVRVRVRVAGRRPPAGIHHERRRRRGRPRGSDVRRGTVRERGRHRRRGPRWRGGGGTRQGVEAARGGGTQDAERPTRTRAKMSAPWGARPRSRRGATGKRRTRRNFVGVNGRGPRPEIRDERRPRAEVLLVRILNATSFTAADRVRIARR